MTVTTRVPWKEQVHEVCGVVALITSPTYGLTLLMMHDMKRVIVNFNPNDETPFISFEIDSYCVPIIILEIWEVHFQLWDLQNMWKDSLRQAESLMMQCPSQWPAIHISVDLHVADGMKRFKAFQVLGEVLLGS